MPSILSEDDKETVKRHVPKQTNKIQAVAVARLYVAYPNRSKWTYTGLQGAVVLANDLVGNTYWLKMVDISSGNRGVIWDQELFDTWNYNQDRVFFHTFELEECLAGLSFVDEKEAKQFLKKMNDREKNASKSTKSTPFGGSTQHSGGHHKHGGLFGGIFGGHRHSSAPTPPESPRANLPPPPPNAYSHYSRPSAGSVSNGTNGYSPPSEFATLEAFDPEWREHFGDDLKSKGLTDDFIRDNQDFIVDFLKQEQQEQQNKPAVHAPPPPPPAPVNGSGGAIRAPPPPPPAASIPTPDPTRSAVLDGIKGAGGIAALKKVDRTKIRDRSEAQVGGASSGDTGPHGSGLPPAGVSGGGGGGMADALALALQKRKEKVSRSDDEDDDDDW
ncbi:WH1-domain-containing protein [Coniochaeta ligniaria NRRL 30616]|uniref:WH1-domain-containing protein n=1 Tax=Coniochaeta ligniaria NRRL 30616 TaxID=1408157 RepID=A0A1J7JTC2_9PEZI|nr:WH1-domain-containing protein [Coniochaeta ligniaria NRRL 30616]